MRTTLTTVILFCFLGTCFAQKSNKGIYKELYQFAVNTGRLDTKMKIPNDDYSALFYVKELISSDSTFSQQYGIYQFETNTEDSGINILFKKKENYEIYDISNFGFFMSRLLSFLNETSFNLTDSIKLKYIREVVNIYKENSELQVNITLKVDHGRFKMFIDSRNFVK